MIHVADTKVANRYGDYFIRQIHRFQEVGAIFSHFFSPMFYCYRYYYYIIEQAGRIISKMFSSDSEILYQLCFSSFRGQ